MASSKEHSGGSAYTALKKYKKYKIALSISTNFEVSASPESKFLSSRRGAHFNLHCRRSTPSHRRCPRPWDFPLHQTLRFHPPSLVRKQLQSLPPALLCHSSVYHSDQLLSPTLINQYSPSVFTFHLQCHPRLLPRVFHQILASTSDCPPAPLTIHVLEILLTHCLQSVELLLLLLLRHRQSLTFRSYTIDVSLGEETVMRFMRKYEEKYNVQDDPVTRKGHHWPSYKEGTSMTQLQGMYIFDGQ